MKMFRMYNDVDDIPMQWNALGVRIPLSAVLILLSDLLLAVAGGELIATFDVSRVTSYLITGVPAGIIALAVIISVIQFSRLGPLPILLQISLLRSVAKNPSWDGLPYDNDEDIK